MSGNDRMWIVLCAMASATYTKANSLWGQIVCFLFWAIILGSVAFLDSSSVRRKRGGHRD